MKLTKSGIDLQTCHNMDDPDNKIGVKFYLSFKPENLAAQTAIEDETPK